jgi:hypothetical protein
MKFIFWPWLAYLLLALLIMAPLLGAGYVFTLDMAWLPHLPWPSVVDSGYVFQGILHILNLILVSWVIQKLVLLTILFLAGLGAHRLALLGLKEKEKGWDRVAPYVAGVLFVVNPFTYERFVVGQYLVLLGYALLPWFAASLFRWLRAPSWRRAAGVLAWGMAICLASIHFIGFAVLIAIIAIAVWSIAQWHDWNRLKLHWLQAGVIALGGVLLNLLWLIPWRHSASAVSAVGAFDERQFQAFATAGSNSWAVLGNVLSLYGFWGERHLLYLIPRDSFGWWWVPGLVIAGVIIAGIWRVVRRRDLLGITLLVVMVMAVFLASGIAFAPMAGVTRWLVAHVPLYRGYREPEKWVAVIALAYSYFAAQGVPVLLSAIRRTWRLRTAESFVAAMLIIAPVGYTPTMLFGASGQLKAVDYPPGWYTVEGRLQADSGNYRVLALPWHQYIYLDFAERTVANPAVGFFDKALSSDDPQLGYTSPLSSLSARIQPLLADGGSGTDIGPALARDGVKYVLLLTTAQSSDYGWLGAQPNFKVVERTPSVTLYQNTSYQVSK